MTAKAYSTADAPAASMVPESVAETICPNCSTVAAASPSPVWAIGTIRHDWVNLSAKKEFEQIRGTVLEELRQSTPEISRASEDDLLFHTLSHSQYQYLASMLCSYWTFYTDGVPTYLVAVAESNLPQLLAIVAPENHTQLAAIIGIRSPAAPFTFSRTSSLPLVVCHKLYHFTRESLIGNLASRVVQRERNDARPIPVDQREAFEQSSVGLFSKLLSRAREDADSSRVLCWSLLRSTSLYVKSFEMMRRDFSLTSVTIKSLLDSVPPSTLRMTLRFSHLSTGFTESYCQDINAEGLHPYPVNGLTPCLEH